LFIQPQYNIIQQGIVTQFATPPQLIVTQKLAIPQNPHYTTQQHFTTKQNRPNTATLAQKHNITSHHNSAKNTKKDRLNRAQTKTKRLFYCLSMRLINLT
jgi:hypothetical protein